MITGLPGPGVACNHAVEPWNSPENQRRVKQDPPQVRLRNPSRCAQALQSVEGQFIAISLEYSTNSSLCAVQSFGVANSATNETAWLQTAERGLPAESDDGFARDGIFPLARAIGPSLYEHPKWRRVRIVKKFLYAGDHWIPWNGCEPEPFLLRIQPKTSSRVFKTCRTSKWSQRSTVIGRDRSTHLRNGLDAVAAAGSQRGFKNRTDDASTSNDKHLAAGFLHCEIRGAPKDSGGLQESSHSETVICVSPRNCSSRSHVVRIAVAHATCTERAPHRGANPVCKFAQIN